MSTEANYHKFSTLPANVTKAIWSDDKSHLVNTADPYKWSGGDTPVPAIGENVKLYVNSLGTGTVTGYFAEYGWLGFFVKLDNPPEWYVKQNGRDKLCHVFGADLNPRKPKA